MTSVDMLESERSGWAVGPFQLRLLAAILAVACVDETHSGGHATSHPAVHSDNADSDPVRDQENADGDGQQGGYNGTEAHDGPPPPKEDALPEKLSETGLYSDIRTHTISPKIIHYTPQFQLWSDGASKERWAYIPENTVIDSSDMDNWSVPVGSRFFKEFSLDGRRIETRLIERVGQGPRDFAFVSYQWNEEQTEATKVSAEGVVNASGTMHDIPSKLNCLRCHGTYPLGGGRPSRMLGFSAIQLSHDDTAVHVDDLSEQLSHPLDEPYAIPGDPIEQAALGYLHANCGNCHHDGEDRVPQVNLSLWLDVDARTVEETGAWKTAVAHSNVLFNDQHVVARIAPGSPEESSIVYRMKQRGNTAQMPPVASEFPDEEGIAVVERWIRGLQ